VPSNFVAKSIFDCPIAKCNGVSPPAVLYIDIDGGIIGEVRKPFDRSTRDKVVQKGSPQSILAVQIDLQMPNRGFIQILRSGLDDVLEVGFARLL